MTTQSKENYGRDVRNFHHPEDDMKPFSEINNSVDLENEIYSSHESDLDDEEIVNQDDDIINNEDDDELNNKFSNSAKRNNDYPAENYLDEKNLDNTFYADEWESGDGETDPKDPEEDFDENYRDSDEFATDRLNKKQLDLEYDLSEL
nr:hypothetical protein [uncultured Flavobacterium sp.]